jgi:hypothetical protein
MSILESRHISIPISIVSFWTKIWMEVPSPSFSISQVSSVIRIEAQEIKNKKFKPNVPIPYLTQIIIIKWSVSSFA